MLIETKATKIKLTLFKWAKKAQEISSWIFGSAMGVFLSASFLVFTIAAGLGVIAITLLTVRVVSDVWVSSADLSSSLSAFLDFLSFSSLDENSSQIISEISQPLILATSALVLFYPLLDTAIKRYKISTSVIRTRPASTKERNRRAMARILATEFKNADRICTISGDFSWFTENKEGRDALDALLSRSNDSRDRVVVISYKSVDEIRGGLKNLDEDRLKRFMDIVKTDAHLHGTKLTIVSGLDHRKLFLIASAKDGEAEQSVEIKDRDYGRRLINTFEGLLSASEKRHANGKVPLQADPASPI